MSNEYVFFFGAKNEFGFLSNWYLSPYYCTAVAQDVSCVEQSMMMMKAATFNDIEALDKLSKTSNPSECKAIGRTIKGFDKQTWDDISMGLVYLTLVNKFLSSDILYEALMATKDKILVEASPYDRIWGIGYDADSALENIDNWGENRLGKCLMYVRRSLTPEDEMVGNRIG